ncbi:hypothetical protein POTOM_000797 [Populus tomentosa]|uniref:2-C-methyl-D-erythritol 2,4-cyclodiphosphate synthase domain-containing protein n=1 Tax=Populus tomentosa TaxID=118781 RepID=A0A8X8IUK9_POPTO|nr:hypothetical protein POTOM_000797 [Populus tomentosa]
MAIATATNLYTSYSPITTKTRNNKSVSFPSQPGAYISRHVKFAVPIQKRTTLSISAASTTAIQVDGPTTSSKASKTLPFRVGHGFDLHRLEPGYPLIIGGIDVPHDRGCEAHSDGDVLLHCVVDAVLGALGLPDIGQIFPDSDPKWKGAPSSVFIKEARVSIVVEEQRISTLSQATVDDILELVCRVYDLRRSNYDSALKSLCFWIDGALKSQYFWIDADETKPLLGTTVLVSSLTGECRRRQARICHRKLPLHDMYISCVIIRNQLDVYSSLSIKGCITFTSEKNFIYFSETWDIIMLETLTSSVDQPYKAYPMPSIQVRLMHEAGYEIGNLDATLILQRPKLSPHKEAIRANLSELLGADPSVVNLKAKTHEKVDSLGENRSIAAHTVVLLMKK